MSLPMVEGTVVQGVVLPQQPYAQQPVQPMAVVQAPYGQPMAVPQACCAPYGGATVVPYVPQPMAPQGPTNAAIQRGPGNQTFPATLASHAGQGIVVKSTICCPCGIFLHPMIICPCCASELRLGPASQAKWLKWDDTREHLTLVDACGQHLNVDDEKFEAQTEYAVKESQQLLARVVSVKVKAINATPKKKRSKEHVAS